MYTEAHCSVYRIHDTPIHTVSKWRSSEKLEATLSDIQPINKTVNEYILESERVACGTHGPPDEVVYVDDIFQAHRFSVMRKRARVCVVRAVEININIH